MESLLGFAPLLLALAAGASLMGLARWVVQETKPPFEVRPSLLNEPLHKLLRALHEAAAGRWLIFPQIRLAEVIQVKEKADDRAYWQEKVSGHRFDFVLFDPQSLAPRLAIDLDTSGANPPPPLDPSLERCLQASGLPHWRVAAGDDYEVREMHKALLKAIG
jgi:hypothetical protein